MLSGGAISKVHYRMENVLLRLGVMINPDDRYYSEEAIEAYNDRAIGLMKEALQKLRRDQDQVEKVNKSVASNHAKRAPSGHRREAKQGLDMLRRSMSFAVY